MKKPGKSVSYTHLDVYKRQGLSAINSSAMEIVTETRPRGFMLDALGGGQFTVSHILIESFALAAVICCVPFYHRMFFSARDGKLARGTIGLATPILILFYTVSYTHLDVYKRQPSDSLKVLTS